MVKLADYLIDNNYEVYVLSGGGGEKNFFGYEGLYQKLNPIVLHDAFQEIRNNSNSSVVNTSSLKYKILRKVRRLIDMFIIPDVGLISGLKFYKKAKILIKKNHIVNVIVTSPLPSNLVLGMLLKRLYGEKINFIIDYRDSWNTTSIFSKKLLPVRWLSERLEKHILLLCDSFVYVTPSMLDKINRRVMSSNVMIDKSYLIRNGFDSSMERNILNAVAIRKKKRFTVGYFGAIDDRINSFRNPEKLFLAVRGLPIEMDVRFYFYGKVDLSGEWSDIINKNIFIEGNVSHSEALKKMREHDALLIVHTEKEGADEVMPGKIYEYISTGNPVLSVGPENLDASHFVESNGFGYVSLNEVENIKNVITEMFDDWKSECLKKYDHKLVEEYDRRKQYSKYLDLLK